MPPESPRGNRNRRPLPRNNSRAWAPAAWQGKQMRTISRLTLPPTAILCALSMVALPMAALSDEQWFKGNTHTHSLWSDGNDFPEMIADWYKKQGYDFLVLSDHNTLSRGERWMKVTDVEKRKRSLGRPIVTKYLDRFGGDWVELRGEGGAREVRLRPLDEIRPQFDEEGKFLLIEGEEITDKFEKLQVPIPTQSISVSRSSPSTEIPCARRCATTSWPCKRRRSD